MSLKRWIAKKLYPEAFEEAEKFRWLRSSLSYDQRWLGEFAEIDAYLTRVLHHLHDRYRPLGEQSPYRVWREDVGLFREQLRQGRHVIEAAKTAS